MEEKQKIQVELSSEDVKEILSSCRRLGRLETKINRWNLFFNIMISIYLVLLGLSLFAQYLYDLIV